MRSQAHRWSTTDCADAADQIRLIRAICAIRGYIALFHRLDSQYCSVRRVSSGGEFRRNVDQSVRPLLNVADADVELRQQRLAPLRLRRLIERDTLKLLRGKRADEEIVFPRRKPIPRIED